MLVKKQGIFDGGFSDDVLVAIADLYRLIVAAPDSVKAEIVETVTGTTSALNMLAIEAVQTEHYETLETLIQNIQM